MGYELRHLVQTDMRASLLSAIPAMFETLHRFVEACNCSAIRYVLYFTTVPLILRSENSYLFDAM